LTLTLVLRLVVFFITFFTFVGGSRQFGVQVSCSSLVAMRLRRVSPHRSSCRSLKRMTGIAVTFGLNPLYLAVGDVDRVVDARYTDKPVLPPFDLCGSLI